MQHNISAFKYKILAILCAPLALPAEAQTLSQPELGYRGAPLIQQDGYQFKDLNRDGKLNKYEDWRLSPAQRAEDLTQRMTLEEKAV